MTKPLTRTQFTERLRQNNPRLELKGKFLKGNSSTNSFKCLDCGRTFKRNNKAILRVGSRGCSDCGQEASKEQLRDKIRHRLLKDLLPVAKERNISVYLPSVTTRSGITKFRCNDCGRNWTTSPKCFLSQKYGCKVCSNLLVGSRVRENTWKTRIEPLLAGKYTVLSIPDGYRGLFGLKCNKCNLEWENTARNIKVVLERGGCPCRNCANLISLKEGYTKRYEITLGGRKVKLRGFEPQGLDWIMDNTSTDPQNISVEGDKNFPVIEYVIAGKIHRYTPDFYIGDEKRVVEVKSTLTAGLCNYTYRGPSPRSLFKTLKAKRRGCVQQGYKFSLLLMTQKGDRLKLPKHWHLYSHDSLMRHLQKQAVVSR